MREDRSKFPGKGPGIRDNALSKDHPYLTPRRSLDAEVVGGCRRQGLSMPAVKEAVTKPGTDSTRR